MGNADAQFQYGAYLEVGELVARDISEAIVWYELAASQFQPDAQYRLGVIFVYGMGVEARPADGEAPGGGGALQGVRDGGGLRPTRPDRARVSAR